MDARPATAPSAATSSSPAASATPAPSSPQRIDVDTPTDAAATDNGVVFAVFHHAKYDADSDDHPGRLTHCWGVYDTFEKAAAKLKEVVGLFPPGGDAEGDVEGDVNEDGIGDREGDGVAEDGGEGQEGDEKRVDEAEVEEVGSDWKEGEEVDVGGDKKGVDEVEGGDDGGDGEEGEGGAGDEVGGNEDGGHEGGKEIGRDETGEEEDGLGSEESELEPQVIRDEYDTPRGVRYRYRTGAVCEEIMWIQTFTVQ